MNQIEIINPKISLLNSIGDPPNSPGKNKLLIAESGANTYLTKQATKTMSPGIISNDMIERLLYGIIMESLYIAVLQIPGISKQAKHIHIFPRMKTAPKISLGVLCDDGCTITLEKQGISVQ